ncbi:MAG: RNA degradosome polyphosphate kinase [Candidatus Nanopelagicales bacterium]
MQLAPSDELLADRYLERELSWLAFNKRVLELAQDSDVPLLERAKFLAIFSGNLDEFFMVRVAGLKRRIAAGIAVRSISGMLPREVHEAVLLEARNLQDLHTQIFNSEVLPQLNTHEIEVCRWENLSTDEINKLNELYNTNIFPVLTPLAVDPAHPFPYISGLSLNLAILLRNPKTNNELFARVKVPPSFPRFINTWGQRFVPLEDVIAANLDALFPGMEVIQHHTFRVTRNEDVEVEEDDAENLLDAMERELSRRKFGPAVRLEIEDTMDEKVLELLKDELEVNDNEIFRLAWPLDLRGLADIHDLDRDDLKFNKFIPKSIQVHQDVETASAANVIEAIKTKDILLHHPYDSFSTTVQRFLEQAAEDPKVLAIKQTLYRTSGDSPIVDALIEAARNGKQVLALVEIKARFDEQANIRWARKLEEAGVHVVYGLVGLKTHAKLSLIIRQEAEGIKRYCHICTGNYNPKTARGYEDLGLLTDDPQIADDVAYLFNLLSGYSSNEDYDRLLVAPHSVRKGLIERVEREILNHKSGLESGIRFKCNSIVDEATIDALYHASRAGVKIELWVRGMCALMPKVPNLSENITVRSILGRFLEHSRIFEFKNAGDTEVWIGSADLMHRNLDRRVEALVQLTEPEHVKFIGDLLDLGLSKEIKAWELEPSGEWTLRKVNEQNEPLQDLHEALIQKSQKRSQLDG